MEVDIYATKFLAKITMRQGLGSFLTHGRQSGDTRWINPKTCETELHCEPMVLQLFGATEVASANTRKHEGEPMHGI